MNIHGHTIAITGAGQGLGRTMAVELAKKGARLAIIDLNPEPMQETQRLISALGGEARIYECNVADEDSVVSTFNTINTDFGGIHGLINNAGILRDGLFVKSKNDEITTMSLANWQMVIDVNLTGVFLCGREAASHMVRNKEPGCLINISVSVAQVTLARPTTLPPRLVLPQWPLPGRKSWRVTTSVQTLLRRALYLQK